MGFPMRESLVMACVCRHGLASPRVIGWHGLAVICRGRETGVFGACQFLPTKRPGMLGIVVLDFLVFRSISFEWLVVFMEANDVHKLIEAYYEDIWNSMDMSRIPELLLPEFSFCGALGHECVGYEAFESYVDRMHASLENYSVTVVDLVVEGERAFARTRYHGMHTGDFFGYRPTGKLVSWEGAVLFTIRENRIESLWAVVDERGLLKLLDAQA
jgi:predicted ester cyclase